MPKKAIEYEILAIPLSVLDWKTPGRLLKDELGANEIDLAHQFDQLLDTGWRVLNFNIVGPKVYFLFERD